MATAEIRRHWTRVAGLGCILTGGGPAEVCHTHGGSIKLLGPIWQPGMSQKQNDWLVLPLRYTVHRIGPHSLDGGSVVEWEKRWEPQVKLLVELSNMLGYCVYEKAGVNPAVVEEALCLLDGKFIC